VQNIKHHCQNGEKAFLMGKAAFFNAFCAFPISFLLQNKRCEITFFALSLIHYLRVLELIALFTKVFAFCRNLETGKRKRASKTKLKTWQ